MKPYGPRPAFGPLFAVPTSPLARKTDPETSKESAAAMKGSRRRGDMHHLVLEAVRLHPGSTASELTAHEGFADPRLINRRLGELEDSGLIQVRGRRRNPATGQKEMCWWPV